MRLAASQTGRQPHTYMQANTHIHTHICIQTHSQADAYTQPPILPASPPAIHPWLHSYNQSDTQAVIQAHESWQIICETSSSKDGGTHAKPFIM